MTGNRAVRVFRTCAARVKKKKSPLLLARILNSLPDMSVSRAARRISGALISASSRSARGRTWNSSLEHTLHRLGCRDSLTPSLVTGVIDPFLLSHHSLALGFFNWAAQQPGFAHSSLTYHSLLKCLSLSRQFATVETTLKCARSQKLLLDPSLYRSVISSFIAGKKTHKAYLIFNDVKSICVDTDAGLCNSLLAALASDKYPDHAQKMFDDMLAKNVPFSTLGFGIFVWNFCRYWELNKTLNLVDAVRVFSSEINGSIVALFIVHGLCHVSRLSEAFGVLEELRKRDFKPDFIAYRVVAEAFRSIGSLSEVEVTLKRKRKLGVAPRTKDYDDFILSLISEKRINEAKVLGEAIVSGNFPMEDEVFNVLIGTASAVDPTIALTFFDSMIMKDKLPTVLTVHNLSKSLIKHGKTNELVEVFRILTTRGFFPDLESYSLMLSMLCKVGEVKEAYAILRQMKKKGIVPDISYYNFLLQACCRIDLVRPAKRLWDEMFTSGFSVNLTSYNILIHKLSLSGEAEEAFKLFGHMLEKQTVPDAATYSYLLQGLCQESKFETAFEVYNKSVEQDASLAKGILTTFTLQLCKQGCFHVVSQLLRDHIRNNGMVGPHVIFLKYLADAREISLASQHINLIRSTYPLMLQTISSELQTAISSSLKPDSIIELLQIMKRIR